MHDVMSDVILYIDRHIYNIDFGFSSYFSLLGNAN